MRLAVWPALFALLVAFPYAYAQPSDVELLNSNYTFVGADGMTNIVGVVNNKGLAPISVTMALDVSVGDATVTLYENPYSLVLFPDTGAPFKFRLDLGMEVLGEPYVANVERVDQPFYDTLVFEYANMAVGDEKVLVGKVTNTGPFPFHEVVVYASVHDREMVQIDSAKSDPIPVIEPGQTVEFEIAPDKAIKDSVLYYSCAGFDPNAPIPTMPAGDGTYIAYNMQTVSKISKLRYDNSTDSVMFGITPYNPAGGPIFMQFAQMQPDQTIVVLMDGQIHDASIDMNGKTISIDMFVPPGEHQVQIQGIRAIPEFPLAAIILAAMTTTVIVAARLKVVFKVP